MCVLCIQKPIASIESQLKTLLCNLRNDICVHICNGLRGLIVTENAEHPDQQAAVVRFVKPKYLFNVIEIPFEWGILRRRRYGGLRRRLWRARGRSSGMRRREHSTRN